MATQPKTESCGECFFWLEGTCHRYPPQAVHNNVGNYYRGLMYVFPQTVGHDWCGEWKRDWPKQ